MSPEYKYISFVKINYYTDLNSLYLDCCKYKFQLWKTLRWRLFHWQVVLGKIGIWVQPCHNIYLERNVYPLMLWMWLYFLGLPLLSISSFSTDTICKQCSVMTTNGYDMVNIIQMSIIFIYPVMGNDWEMPIKLKNMKLWKAYEMRQTYYVVKTSSKVALTSMTISRYDLLNVVIIWLINNSIAVGRNIVKELLVRGLLIIMSMNNPDLPYLSTRQ